MHKRHHSTSALMSIPSQRPRRKFRKRNSKYAENCLWHRTMMDAVFRRTWQLTDGRRRQNLENSPEVWWSATLHKRELFLNHKLCRTAQHEQSLKKAISSREKTIFSYIPKPHVALWQTQMAMHKGCAFPTASYAPYLLPMAHTRPIQPREGGGGKQITSFKYMQNFVSSCAASKKYTAERLKQRDHPASE